MKARIVFFAVLFVVAPTANAWFFFFIPPGAIEKLQGKKGHNCVAAEAKVGDEFRSVNGDVLTVKSVSGTSTRCQQPERPVLAEIEYASSPTFSAKAGIEVPDGYKMQPLTDIQRFNGGLLMAKQSSPDCGVFVTSVKSEAVSDLDTYTANLLVAQAKRVDDAKQSEIEHFSINGLESRRFEVDGKIKNLYGTRYTYVTTVLQGSTEVVMVNAWSPTSKYDKKKPELIHIAETIVGLSPPIADNSSVSGQLPSSSSASKSPEFSHLAPPNSATPQAAKANAASPADGGATLSSPTDTVSERLKRLNELYKSGLIEKNEYEAKKAEILRSL
jgi:hypothetical protein